MKSLHRIQNMRSKTTPAHAEYTVYELETFVVIGSVKKIRIYLLGTNFKIITDQSSF